MAALLTPVPLHTERNQGVLLVPGLLASPPAHGTAFSPYPESLEASLLTDVPANNSLVSMCLRDPCGSRGQVRDRARLSPPSAPPGPQVNTWPSEVTGTSSLHSVGPQFHLQTQLAPAPSTRPHNYRSVSLMLHVKTQIFLGACSHKTFGNFSIPLPRFFSRLCWVFRCPISTSPFGKAAPLC